MTYQTYAEQIARLEAAYVANRIFCNFKPHSLCSMIVRDVFLYSSDGRKRGTFRNNRISNRIEYDMIDTIVEM